jgi:hypothetical protein
MDRTLEALMSTREGIPFLKRQGFKNAALVVGTLLIAYGMANLEIVRRARAAYQRGEEAFAQKKYKEALWSYQEVQEFYYLPRTRYVEKAAEKEFTCRAYLGDWVPPEGPMDADVRVIRAAEYEKFKAAVAQITPVGDTSYQPAPPMTPEKAGQKKAK